MTGGTAFRCLQGLYWLGLGTWFGAIVMLVVAAAVTFRTVERFRPTLGLAPYDAPVFAERAAGILAGGVTGASLRGLTVIQVVCALVVCGVAAIQCRYFPARIVGGVAGGANLLRVALIGLPMLLLVADVLWVAPKIRERQAAMYDPAASDQGRAAARAGFDRLHHLNVRMLGATGLLVAAAVFASAFALYGEADDQYLARPAAPSGRLC